MTVLFLTVRLVDWTLNHAFSYSSSPCRKSIKLEVEKLHFRMQALSVVYL